jgi:hypothetical protein
MIRTGVTAALAVAVLGITASEAQAKYCDVKGSEQGLADLRAGRGASCPVARRVYRKSQRLADPESTSVRFIAEGSRWRCRKTNPQRVIDGQYVHYVWKCMARERVVRYRWLAPELPD